MKTSLRLGTVRAICQTPLRFSGKDLEGPDGFTLVELMLIIGILAFIGIMLVPALAKTRPGSRSMQCLNNHRQMISAWRMYAEDNSDRIIYNFEANKIQIEITSQTYRNWANNVLDWTSNPSNTNLDLLRKGIMTPYLGGNINAYKCPADDFLSNVQSLAGFTGRTRSIAMNAFFGPFRTDPQSPLNSYNEFFSSYRQWVRTSQVAQPAGYWVFIDEHPDSIITPYFLNNPQGYGAGYWGDMPASHHDGCATVTFSDGNSVIHKWLSARTQIQVRYSRVAPAFDDAGRTDYRWLMDRTAVLR